MGRRASEDALPVLLKNEKDVTPGAAVALHRYDPRNAVQMGATSLHRASPLHLQNETPQNAQIQSEGHPSPLAENGQDQRNRGPERQPRGQRPYDG